MEAGLNSGSLAWVHPLKGKLYSLSCWKAGRLPLAQQEPPGTLHSWKTGPHCLCQHCVLRENAFTSFVSLEHSYTSAPLCCQPSLPHWAHCRSSRHSVRFLFGSYSITGKCCSFLKYWCLNSISLMKRFKADFLFSVSSLSYYMILFMELWFALT